MKMKNKKAEQIKKKKEHLEKVNKAKKSRRRNTPTLERESPFKVEKERILIVCEGSNTEPSYFNKFKLTSATIKSVGEGLNTISLVERAIELSKEDSYDQVWCVFDKDDFPSQNFNNAIFKAIGSNFKLAYSNQAFEYWLILHFEDHQGGGMNRNDYYIKINQYLKAFDLVYDSNSKKITDEIFEVLISTPENESKSRQEIACERANRIYSNLENINPALEESSTLVYKLVQEIEKYK